MKVILARKAGFCMGVRRAVDTTLDMVHREDQGIATFGPLIHNPQVLDLLREQGVRILNEIPESASGTIIIRAHGVPPTQRDKLELSGARIKDATCPRVVKVQVIINKYREQGYTTIIIGDRNHAEVEGLMGYAEPRGQVVSDEKDVEKLEITTPYIIVSQTTQDETAFQHLSRLVLDRFPGGKVFNTICDSTHKRQDEVRQLCGKVQALVVVGGKTSANTKRLGEIAESMGRPVFMVESEDDLDNASLAGFDCVGVTAGASTPNWMINRIVRALESLPGRGNGVLRASLYKLVWLLLVTNLYVSLGGGMLACTSAVLQSITPSLDHFLIAFGYLFAMHNLNRFTDQKSKRFNDPARAAFYDAYRWPLLAASVLTLSAALYLGYGLGRRPFLVLAVMSVLGILYRVRFIPKSVSAIIRVRRLKEIPGSKTFFVAMAWAFVVGLIPALQSDAAPDLRTLAVFLFVLLLVFVRNALFDVFDVQGDRIVGKETLPVCIGEKRTIRLLHLLMGVLLILLLSFPMLGWFSPMALWLIPGVLYLAGLILLYERGTLTPGPRLEFGLESLFILVALPGLLASLYG